jgi:hypothetical protein
VRVPAGHFGGTTPQRERAEELLGSALEAFDETVIARKHNATTSANID